MSAEAAGEALDELTRQQVELELQNAELRRTQLRLLSSRAHYFDLYNGAPVGYFTLNEAGAIQKANLTAAALLGVGQGALAKQPFALFIQPDDLDVYCQHRRRLLETGTRQICELRVLRCEGDARWVRLEATSATARSGAPICRVAMSDITERRHTEDTLRASEARHRILFEQSHDALMTLAPPDWRFASANSTTLAMFGARDVEDFLSRPPSEYSPAWQLNGIGSADAAATMIEIAMSAGSHFYEWTFRRFSGQEFLATVLLTRMEIDGHPLLHATVRDETEVKRLQALLRQSDRLTSMGTLAAGVAHEINNPLTYVLHSIECLSESLPKLSSAITRTLGALRSRVGVDTFERLVGTDAPTFAPPMLDEMSEFARDALDGTERIKTISRALGTFSRVESTERFQVDLNYAVECAATMAKTAIKFRAQLSVDLAKLPLIWASEGKLSQVFLNLLINAAHAIDEGDVLNNRIAIRTWRLGEDVFAEVKDTGRGMSEANRARIFEPFFTTKATGVGSGLGLSICSNIVTEFGGDIKVASELGKGTRITVRLPIGASASVAPPPSASSTRVVEKRGRVLLIDDEQPILAMLVHLLRRDHELVTAASGEAAKAILLEDQSFDVILCDLMMAGMSGMALHEWLATEHPALAAQMVFVSGGAFTPAASAYVTRVGNLRIDKPYDNAKLRKIVADRVVAARASSRLGMANGS